MDQNLKEKIESINNIFLFIQTINNSKSWKEINGWFTENDAISYQSIVSRYLNGNFAEIGSWKGRSFSSVFHILKLCGYKNIYTIDTWNGDKDSGYEFSQYHEVVAKDIFDEFTTNLKNLGFDGQYTPIKLPSTEASKQFDDEFFDIVFIDADHSYDAVVEDIRAWLPKVKKDGILCGHDILHIDVRKALEDEAVVYTTVPDNIWFHIKK